MDPYVGTGSILIAAAARGAVTFGSDIDHRIVMAGKTHPKTGARITVFSNYEQYQLQWPVGVLRMDVHRHPFRTGLTEVRLWVWGGGGLQVSVCVCRGMQVVRNAGRQGVTLSGLQLCVLMGCCGWMCTDTGSGQG